VQIAFDPAFACSGAWSGGSSQCGTVPACKKLKRRAIEPIGIIGLVFIDRIGPGFILPSKSPVNVPLGKSAGFNQEQRGLMSDFRLPVLLRVVASASLIAASVAPALAAKIEAGTISVESSNLCDSLTCGLSVSGPGVSTYDDYSRRDYSTRVTYESSSVVQTPPTDTSAGLKYLYETPITTRSWLEDSWRFDNLSVEVASLGQNQNGGKWISIGGTVNSALDLSISFSLQASGKFTPTSTPFGSAVPLLASFYFGASPGSVTPVPGSNTLADLSTLSYSTNTYNSSIQSTTFSLTAGTPQTFIAYVYAGSGVSVEGFDLFAKTGLYDFNTTSGELITRGTPVLVGAETIAPIPGAEPVVMIASGLAVAAAVARRRRKNPIAQCSAHG
jgi:hypothetical protein